MTTTIHRLLVLATALAALAPATASAQADAPDIRFMVAAGSVEASMKGLESMWGGGWTLRVAADAPLAGMLVPPFGDFLSLAADVGVSSFGSDHGADRLMALTILGGIKAAAAMIPVATPYAVAQVGYSTLRTGEAELENQPSYAWGGGVNLTILPIGIYGEWKQTTTLGGDSHDSLVLGLTF